MFFSWFSSFSSFFLSMISRQFPAFYCIVLQLSAFSCTFLHSAAAFCILLHSAAPSCILLHYPAGHRILIRQFLLFISFFLLSLYILLLKTGRGNAFEDQYHENRALQKRACFRSFLSCCMPKADIFGSFGNWNGKIEPIKFKLKAYIISIRHHRSLTALLQLAGLYMLW